MKYRTDLAIENLQASRTLEEDSSEGIEVIIRRYEPEIKVTDIRITSHTGSVKLGKPLGTYVTIEAEGIIDGNLDIKPRIIDALTEELRKLVIFQYGLTALVVGLGNRTVTPDSLGPVTADKIRVSRHLFVATGAQGDEDMANVSCVAPGVLGSTGLETAHQVKQLASIVSPDVVVVIDSLAAMDISRVSTTIQINDTGIAPGGGMGNHREAIDEEFLGTRVIAIGVPTVIDIRTIIGDALVASCRETSQIEKYLEEYEADMVVTSTDIDEVIKEFSDIIAMSINKTLHPGIYS